MGYADSYDTLEYIVWHCKQLTEDQSVQPKIEKFMNKCFYCNGLVWLEDMCTELQ